MNLNELIKKYEEEINEINEIVVWGSIRNEKISIVKYEKEKKIYEEILSDLEQLKEKIENKDDYTFGLYYKEDILGE